MKFSTSVFVLCLTFTCLLSFNLEAQNRTFVPTGTQTASSTTHTKSKKTTFEANSPVSTNTKTSKKKKNDTETYPRVATMIDFAEQYLGVPYKWGGTTSRGFDCSGYVQYVYQHAGYQLERVSKDQSKEGKKVRLKKVQKGDLLFFGDKKRKISHVGMVVSDKGEPIKMIHAGSSTGVTISNVESSDYWMNQLQKARRVLNKHELKMVNAKNKRQLKRAVKKYNKKMNS